MSGWHVCEAAPWLPEPIIRDARGWAVATALQPNNSRAAGIDAKANARLIAAAPAMKTALDSMVMNYAQFGRVTDDFVRDVAQLLLAIERARA